MPALMTVKQIVSQASLEVGIALTPIGGSIAGTRDQDIIQMASLLSAVADEVLLEEPYRVTLGDGMWMVDTNGVPKSPPPTDDDIILFDSRLAIVGLKFKFLAAKGLEFGEQMRDFTSRINKLAGMVNGRVIDLDVDTGRDL
jgi:hypothetical protein